MKTLTKYLLFALSSLVLFSCSPKAANSEKDFKSVLDTLATTNYYAVVDVGEPLLLVTDWVYEFEAGMSATVQANAYTLSPDGSISCHGEIRSQGTAYPFSVVDGNLLLQGHHFSKLLSVKDGELITQKEYTEIYFNGGDTVNYFMEDALGNKSEIDSIDYSTFMEKISQVEIIQFKSR